MDLLFGGDFDYGRGGLALVAPGHGLPPHGGHAQPGRARARPRRPAAAAWLGCALAFLAWLLLSPLDDTLLEVEVGYCATTAVLAGLLWAIERSAPWGRLSPQ